MSTFDNYRNIVGENVEDIFQYDQIKSYKRYKEGEKSIGIRIKFGNNRVADITHYRSK